MFPSVRALTFDFWNTLVSAPAGGDRRRLFRRRILLEVASSCRPGVTAYDVAQAEEAVVMRYEQARRVDFKGTNTDLLVREIWKLLNVGPDEASHREVVGRFEQGILVAPPQPTEGVFEMLESLYRTYPLGIISDTLFSPGRVIREYLAQIDMLRFFRSFVFSDETGVVKPHERAFRTAAVQLETEPGLILHAGDLRVTDVAGARAHGFRAIQYVGVWHDPEPGPDPEAIVEHWSALPSMLDQRLPAFRAKLNLSSPMTHPPIPESASVGEHSELGFGVVIGNGVEIGPECRIGNYVVIHSGTKIGSNVRIDDHAVVGKQPMRSPRSAMTSVEPAPPAVIGDHVQIGTGTVIYAGCRIDPFVLVADLATVREAVEVGEYTIVGRGVAIENACRVGRRCKIETNAYLAAKTIVEDDVFVAPGVLTSNDNFLGRTEERFKHFGGPHLRSASRLGVGAIVLPGRIVETEAVVAAGAVLTHDARAGIIHAGVPAHELRPVPDDQFLNQT